eukprot:15340756-Ditylum_brightwellii.AAC.1
MSEIFADIKEVCAYINGLLLITNGDRESHLQKLNKLLSRLKCAGLKFSAKKSFFGCQELEYLGYWVTRQGIKPLQERVEAILKIAPPKAKKQCSEVLAPLALLISKATPWKWMHVKQTAFKKADKIISQEALLAYLDFNVLFEIHTDASDTQLGAVISQQGMPVVFHSRKLNSIQRNYTNTEQELLAIVETLKEFKNILLGQQIRVYTDHKNLTYIKSLTPLELYSAHYLRRLCTGTHIYPRQHERHCGFVKLFRQG